MATKLGRMVTYLKWFPPIKLLGAFTDMVLLDYVTN